MPSSVEPNNLLSNHQFVADGDSGESSEAGACDRDLAQSSLRFPWGVAFNPVSREIVVSDASNNRLQFFSLTTQESQNRCEYLRSVGKRGKEAGQFSYPEGLCYQPGTNLLLVCDYFNHRVQALSPQDQSVYVLGRGGPTAAAGGFSAPDGICCTSKGEIVVTEWSNNRVQLFDAGGRFLRKFGKSGKGEQDLNNVYDVALLERHMAPSAAASGLLLLSDFGNQRLSAWTADGAQAVCTFQLQAKPRGLCVDMNGLVVVSTNTDLMFLEPRRDFSCIQTLGSYGSKPGQFSTPTGVCVDDTNTLVVVDHGNNRIQLFD